MGGTSAEREVSLRSGRAVARALERRGHDVVRLELDSARQSLRALSEARLDVAFLALHGRLGEDGCVQGVLELLGVPYTGSSVLGSALAMDKAKAKEIFQLHNVPTPAYYVFEMYRQHMVAQLAKIRIQCEELKVPSSEGTGKMPALSGSASVKGKTLYVTLTNPSLDAHPLVRLRRIGEGHVQGLALYGSGA